MAVKRNCAEVWNLLQNLIVDGGGANEVLNEMFNVMSTDEMADVLEEVADNWDLEVSEDGETEYN